jgi:hypothetical protein
MTGFDDDGVSLEERRESERACGREGRVSARQGGGGALGAACEGQQRWRCAGVHSAGLDGSMSENGSHVEG